MEKQFRTKNEIMGAFSKWIVRQYPYPDELQEMLVPALKEVESCCNNWEDSKHDVLGILDTRDFVRSIISVSPKIKIFNTSKTERAKGLTESTVENVFIDRYSSITAAHDFIDLDALERNIVAELNE